MKNQHSSEQNFIVAAGGVLYGLVVALLLFLVISIMMLCISCEDSVALFYAYMGWFIIFILFAIIGAITCTNIFDELSESEEDDETSTID